MKTQDATTVDSPYEHIGLEISPRLTLDIVIINALMCSKWCLNKTLKTFIYTPIGGNKQTQQGLKELEKKKDIIIRLADKGVGIVVLDKKDYKKELNRLIEDKETYN